jgi:general stress protein 26
MQPDSAVRKKLWGMIEKHRFAMRTTQEAGGALHSRPLTTLSVSSGRNAADPVRHR